MEKEKSIIVGIDIGGTKCAVSFAYLQDEDIVFLDKVKMKTEKEQPQIAIERFIEIICKKFSEHPEWQLMSIGISCGGPLNVSEGLIMSPPNLPKWEKVDMFTPLKKEFRVPVMIQNDADACALAEWTFGAGKKCKNMIFLTFGTGMGAGLILNGELYSGTTGMAGEVGHIRLEKDGPFAYGKHGSFESFCSGSGIADMGKRMAKQSINKGKIPLFCKNEAEIENISCKLIAEALEQGDEIAKIIFNKVGKELGKGLAILIDILNPEKIVIGSIYVRQKEILEKTMLNSIKEEALLSSREVCEIVPASLGEMIGDYAAISVGIKAYQDLYRQS